MLLLMLLLLLLLNIWLLQILSLAVYDCFALLEPLYPWLLGVVVAVAALQSPDARYSAEVIRQGLRAIVNLAAGNDLNQARLGDHGACAGACLSCIMLLCYCLLVWPCSNLAHWGPDHLGPGH